MPFTDEQKRAYRAVLAPNATEDQWSYFIAECERRNLIPGVHVVFQVRKAREFSPQLQRDVEVAKVTLVTTINALRLIAERSGKFRGYGKFTYYYVDEESNQPTQTSPIPLGRIPHAVSVELFREGWVQPVFSVARYDACVQTKADKTPTQMWFKRGEEQLAKCAEANGLRMVAPEECGGLYLDVETGESEPATAEQSKPDTAPVVVPTPAVAPVVNQAPAQLPQTSPFAEVAQASAFTPAKPLAVGDKVQQPDGKIEPVVAAGPKPPAQSKPPATQKSGPPAPPSRPAPPAPPKTPASTPAATQPPAPPALNRQPIEPGESHETQAELTEFADRVERDTTPPGPVTVNAHGVAVSDNDLPENLRAPHVDPTTPSPDGGKAQAAALLAPANATPPVVVAPKVDQPATSAEYEAFMQRAAKIVRDKLEKDAKVKGAADFMKKHLFKKSGKDKLKAISAATFEEIISELEKATPEQAAAIVKG